MLVRQHGEVALKLFECDLARHDIFCFLSYSSNTWKIIALLNSSKRFFLTRHQRLPPVLFLLAGQRG
jgi:hypothetical protein